MRKLQEPTVATTRSQIAGSWHKVQHDAAAADFPDNVTFYADGTYRAAPSGERRGLWDEASYDLLDDGRIRIETSNDRKVNYDLEWLADELVISSGNKRVVYRKQKGEKT